MQPVNKMWSSADEFMLSIDEGIALIQGNLTKDAPNETDMPTLKSLLAVFISATIQLESFSDPQVIEKFTVVRMALLAAYNLGRKSC